MNPAKDNVAMLSEMLAEAAAGRASAAISAPTPLAPEHSHLIELAARRILCTCRPCHIVFEPAGAAQGKYRAIPNRYREVAEFVVDDATWDALQLPIGLVFFFYNSTGKANRRLLPESRRSDRIAASAR